MIDIDEKVFLSSFESFERHLLPFYNKERKEKGESQLTTQDQKVNLFLDLREKYGMTKNAAARENP